MSSEQKWYAIYTHPRAEKKVAQQLTDSGIEVYLPLQTTLKQWSDRKKKTEEPLFKSYLFVHIAFEKDQASILQTPGVVKFIKIGKELVDIRAHIIQAIKLSLLHFDDITLSNETYHENQAVTVIAGPLKGYNGTIVEQHGNKYFAIQIEQLGTHVLLKVPAAYLQSL